jgi:hypothetical protein
MQTRWCGHSSRQLDASLMFGRFHPPYGAIHTVSRDVVDGSVLTVYLSGAVVLSHYL